MRTERSCSYVLGPKTVQVYGGPYVARPKGTYGINMAAELGDLPSDVHVPTVDFDVPPEGLLLDGLRKGLLAMALGRKVYVGCMGGIGRTGLYLAAMAKALGEPNPVAYVRRNYLSHAVETREQQEYIRNLDVSSLRFTVLQAKVIKAILFWR